MENFSPTALNISFFVTSNPIISHKKNLKSSVGLLADIVREIEEKILGITYEN